MCVPALNGGASLKEHGLVHIPTPVGPIDCDVEIERSDDQWIGRLLARPGVVTAAQVTGATREEVFANLTELAEREHQAEVDREMKLFGGAPS